jgi:hypothetical protein
MSAAISGLGLSVCDLPDVAEFIIGPAEGRTRWLIRATTPHAYFFAASFFMASLIDAAASS